MVHAAHGGNAPKMQGENYARMGWAGLGPAPQAPLAVPEWDGPGGFAFLEVCRRYLEWGTVHR